ncbi:uncharacterized protein LOC115224715 [Octopus sinensis]|uniref:Uncharacterized protein LOC115224715 n=1 Tax=Octopus sinensis TaxID=2607531 RepID=A0A7E6FPW6_9MOLL|nr:uncharacterized protein LOC115224715 [Octopus sinensis]XP_036369737.1 uncharacterized protein LOC115224715 [Octopus sinensis]
MDVRTSSTLWLLFLTTQCATALLCYQCQSNFTHSDCENNLKLKEFVVNCKDSYCAVESLYIDGKTNIFSRHCSNGSMTIANNPKMKHLNAETNITVYARRKGAVVAASICNKDYCNGPANTSPKLRLQFSLIILSISLFYTFLSFASFNTLNSHHN